MGIDLDLIKQNTIYQSPYSRNHKIPNMLWDVLESFDERERKLFLKFAWGRTQLPPDGSSKWGDGFQIGGVSGAPTRTQAQIDGMLPASHTCFFTIDMPAYSSFEIMKDRILFAIRNCAT